MVSTKEWISFFQEARIPRSAAAQYAMTFTENRITMDMLMDLNKEYLKDMGITVLGDIIAILKHAKQVQSRLTSDRALNQSDKQDPLTIVNGESKSSLSSQNSSPIREKSNLNSREARVIKTARIEEPSNETEKPKAKSGNAGLTSSIVNRLGPPTAKPFGKEQPLPPVGKKKNIFSRLGKDVNSEQISSAELKVAVTATSDELSKQDMTRSTSGILRKRLGNAPQSVGTTNIIRLKPSASESSLTIKKPSEKTHDKRVSFGNKQNPNFEENANVADGIKRKKYVMVTTRRDGTKVKEYLDPEDPRIAELGVTKKMKMTSDGLGSRTTEPDALSSFAKEARSELTVGIKQRQSNERYLESITTTGNYKNMRITLSNEASEMRNQTSQRDGGQPASAKFTQGVRKRIRAPESTSEREPVNKSKFRSRTEILPPSENLLRSSINSHTTSSVKDRISSPWEHSSSHFKPKISRITAPDAIDKDHQSHQMPVARKRISTLESSKAGNVSSRLAGRLGTSVSRKSF